MSQFFKRSGLFNPLKRYKISSAELLFKKYLRIYCTYSLKQDGLNLDLVNKSMKCTSVGGRITKSMQKIDL